VRERPRPDNDTDRALSSAAVVILNEDQPGFPASVADVRFRHLLPMGSLRVCDPISNVGPKPPYSVIQSDVNNGAGYYEALDVNFS
jgi:hypothetical protein